MRTPRRSTVIALAALWLMSMASWSHVSANQHLSGQASHAAEIVSQVSASSDTDCGMGECADVGHLSHCDIPCQNSFNSVSAVIISFNSSTLSLNAGNYSFQEISLAINQRPPKHSI